MDPSNLLYLISIWLLPVLLAITLHEAGHAFAAHRLGDSMAYNLGRVTLNPLKHVDPVGTILIPGILLLTNAPFLFGWAKPVPVRFGHLNNPRRDIILVAAAGPAANLIIAAIAALLFNMVAFVPEGGSEWVIANLRNAIIINLVLAVFNLFPLPPLDGGRIAVGLLPSRLAWPLARLEPYGFLILIALVFLLPSINPNLAIVSKFLWGGVQLLLPIFQTLANLF